MRRLDEVMARWESSPAVSDIGWACSRIRRLEDALRAAKRQHTGVAEILATVSVTNVPLPKAEPPCKAILWQVPCSCGAAEQHAAIDAALNEDA